MQTITPTIMTDTTIASLMNALEWRYATKAFDTSRSIPADTYAQIREAIRLTPSSFGLQPWRFIEVNDKETRAKMRELGWNQSQFTDADKLLVFASRTDMTAADVDAYVADMAATRGVPADALQGYREMMLGSMQAMSPEQQAAWASRQLYIALGFGLAAAAAAQVDAVAMEGFDKDAVTKLLGLDTQGLYAHVVLALGYRSADDKYATLAKVRYPAEQVFITK